MKVNGKLMIETNPNIFSILIYTRKIFLKNSYISAFGTQFAMFKPITIFNEMKTDMDIASALQQQRIIPSANPTDGGQTTAEVARERAEAQRVDFLNILLTQLANQNPLDPMNTDEFAAQLTRFSILEQGIETNESLAQTNDYLQSSATASAFNFIGKEVEIETNMNVVKNDSAKWSYVIDGDASDVKLTVTDDSGRRIGEFDGSIEKGVQTFTLDTSTYDVVEGQALFISINPTNGDGGNLNSRSTSRITVDGVWSDNKESYLTAGELSFRQSDVLKVIEIDNSPAQQQPII